MHMHFKDDNFNLLTLHLIFIHEPTEEVLPTY